MKARTRVIFNFYKRLVMLCAAVVLIHSSFFVGGGISLFAATFQEIILNINPIALFKGGRVLNNFVNF